MIRLEKGMSAKPLVGFTIKQNICVAVKLLTLDVRNSPYYCQ